MIKTHPTTEFNTLMDSIQKTTKIQEKTVMTIKLFDVLLDYGQQEKYKKDILKRKDYKLFRIGFDKAKIFTYGYRGKYEHVFHPYISKFERILKKYDPVYKLRRELKKLEWNAYC